MSDVKQMLTLDGKVTYQIKVPGRLDESWFEWGEEMTITVETNLDGMPVTALTGSFDQAALQGLLRWLYSMGVPLISVICVEFGSDD